MNLGCESNRGVQQVCLVYDLVKMCLPILNWRRSLLACRTVLAVALLCSTVGILYCDPNIWSRSDNNKMMNNHNNHEVTNRETTSNIAHPLNIISQELVTPSTNNQTMDISYCHQKSCKIIECSIPAQLDPGEITRKYIESKYKNSCGLNDGASLVFEKSTFPDNKLQKNWLKTKLAINKLTFINCSLTTLDEEAFASQIFQKTTKLHLWNNKISVLRKATFNHLPNLQEFFIEGNKLIEAERNLLNGVANSLESLSLQGVVGNNAVLRNITGANVLSKVTILSLRFNNIPTVESSLFFGVPYVNSLYLSNSHVMTVCANAFEPMSKTVLQITLDNNNIASLPKGLFNSIIRHHPKFGLTIHDNPWHCDCDLKWLQDMITRYPDVIISKTMAICSSPKKNADKSFLYAEFCNETTDTTIGADLTTCDEAEPTTAKSTSTTESTQIIHIKCNTVDQLLQLNYSHQLFVTNDLELPLRLVDFYATELDNGSVKITLPNTRYVSLIWFNNDARLNVDSLRQSVRCISKVRSHYVLDNVEPQASYTICSSDNVKFSPLNCLGLTTRVVSSSGSWLSKIDTKVIIAVFVSSLIFVCLVSAVLMFITVRQHPAMLRGSKRVVIVKRRSPNAMILPKGISSETIESAKKNTVSTISRNLNKIEYVIPLPPSARNSLRRNSRTSEASVKSDGPSYISGVEPTLSQLNTWRLKRSLSVICRIEPPPLPPHPRRDEQSLTMADSSEHRFDDDIICNTYIP
ncbi:leucine-rich repeat transmembrane protein FLRT3-like [Pseudomyrmex gracilis]|uniref:leucine-rich repeat transmembrane protein FLRT3-like n=1 Tax=Pseudomyrmex gracilis TaxID=219809 RepID=UPI000994E9A9|nr:leucine-rich repeat transmembrane protein FLRT3-like [Pseudomyrmex gracilis]